MKIEQILQIQYKEEEQPTTSAFFLWYYTTIDNIKTINKISVTNNPSDSNSVITEIENQSNFIRWCTAQDREICGKILAKYMYNQIINDRINFQ